MSKLLSQSTAPDDRGRIQCIDPVSAGWEYVGFEVFKLKAGANLDDGTGGTEVCLVLLSGKADIATANEAWRNLGERSSVFDQQAPHAVYLPPDERFGFVAHTDVELAVCKAPAKGEYPARLIRPEDCQFETRGRDTNRRHVCNILFGNANAERLLVCEVLTPGGNWSSYPPHKHDDDRGSEETQLEEIYYHRIDPPQGFAFQRVYNDDRSLDETMTVTDDDVVMVPEGYHPVGAPHGYDLYYLNVMAGPRRKWLFHNDPDHEWIIAS